MKVLIDTNVLLWFAAGDERLGLKARNILSNPANRVFISYFSVFEITIKSGAGKIEVEDSIIEESVKAGLELLMPDLNTLTAYTVLNPNNKDPFDNALMCVAIQERYTFMTSDRKILSTNAEGLKILDATR